MRLKSPAIIASKIGSWTLLSRVAGYVRDMLMAQLLGASAVAEAFQVAFTFPNLFRNLFGEGAMNAALIPHFTHIQTNQGAIAARKFLGDVVLLVGGLMLLITALAYFWMPEIVAVFAWGFEDAAKIDLTIALARTCLPYLFCIILAAIFGGILNQAGQFSVPAAAPILLNLLMIAPLAYGVFWGDVFSIFTLAYGVVIAGVLQLMLCLLVAWRIGYLPIIRHRLLAPELTQFGWLLLPGIVSGLCLQANLIVSRAFASTLSEGSIIWLFFAERMFQLPLALIGISLAIALLPSLSRAISSSNQQQIADLSRQAQQAAIILAVPAAVGLMLCAELIIDVLFGRGAFSAADVRYSGQALQALALGLPAYIMVKIVQPLFFARRNTKTPMYIAFIMMAVNIIFASILMQYFAHVGLALATALAGWAQVILLLLSLKMSRTSGLFVGIFGFIVRVLAATMVMAGLIFALQWGFDLYTPNLMPTLQLACIVLIAGTGYLLAAMIFTGYKWREMFQKSTQ